MTTQIQEVLQQMRAAYIEKLPQQLDNVESLLAQLVAGTERAVSSENLHRAIHSLKGTAGTYGITIISTVCYPFEDHLEYIQEILSTVSAQQLDLCVKYFELLRTTCDQVMAGNETFPEIEARLAELQEPGPQATSVVTAQ